MKELDIARECGAWQSSEFTKTILMKHSQFAAYTARIRAEERADCDRKLALQQESYAREMKIDAERIRTETGGECAKKFQAEVDHAAINDLRLVPQFGQARGAPGIAASAIEAAIYAIRAGGDE